MSKNICCGVLEKMNIEWMVLGDGAKCMPFIDGNDGARYRVNHCPSCGTNVRNALIPPTKQETQN